MEHPDSLAESEEELRRCQAALARSQAESRAKDEFIGLVSHELRAPLGSILIWSQLLRANTPDEAMLIRALGMIERGTRTLTRLIDDLLDGSRIIAGTLQVDKAPVELRPLLEAAVETERATAASKGIALALRPDPPSLRVLGEARRLQQVFGNLLSNAVKFTTEGGRVDVGLESSGEWARVQVTDTGVGIAAGLLPHVFDRVRPATSQGTPKGLGLGLPIALHLVERHGGRIEAASDGEGQGSTFSVSLPLLRSEMASVAGVPALVESSPRPPAGSRMLEGRSVLLVDDQLDALEAMAVLLRQAGARVEAVGSAAEAMAALEQGTFDVILSDIAMPVEDGYVLIRRLRQHPHGAQVPALAITAYATVEDRGKALAAGYDQHMAKPVDPGRLLSVVAEMGRLHVRKR